MRGGSDCGPAVGGGRPHADCGAYPCTLGAAEGQDLAVVPAWLASDLLRSPPPSPPARTCARAHTHTHTRARKHTASLAGGARGGAGALLHQPTRVRQGRAGGAAPQLHTLHVHTPTGERSSASGSSTPAWLLAWAGRTRWWKWVQTGPSAAPRPGRQLSCAIPNPSWPPSNTHTHTPSPPPPPPSQVYELLADRASGPGEQAVSLERREEYYQAAVLQVCVGGGRLGMHQEVLAALRLVTCVGESNPVRNLV